MKVNTQNHAQQVTQDVKIHLLHIETNEIILYKRIINNFERICLLAFSAVWKIIVWLTNLL